MTNHQLMIQIIGVLCFTILLATAILLLSLHKKLFLRVRNLWLRNNLAVLSIAIVFMLAMVSLQSGELSRNLGKMGIVNLILKQMLQIVIIAFFVFNVAWLVSRIRAIKSMSFTKYHLIIILTIVVSAVFIYTTVSYVDNGMKFNRNSLHISLSYAYFNSIVTGLIFTALSYVELERKRKLNEKELEVTRLIALKTKAELDALHSKINPHFLYNALNSIADLSITDGKKARKMTIALADLFRYSINYSQNNYSTVNDEVTMTEVYLQIEKIRFEDQLNYSVNVEEDAGHYLVPRFILQPIVENAVKHGLKATGKMTEIFLEVKKKENGLTIIVADNGPAFPEDLIPGYGVKSVFDKLDLLFTGAYEIHFSNTPRKQVSIYIYKLTKNEPDI
jgi:sensor histidine kinase YesM